MPNKKISQIYDEDPTVNSLASDDLLLISRNSGGGRVSKAIKGQYFASQAELDSHTSDINNPHSVTKAQVGLGNVPNLDTTNAVAHDHTHGNKALLDTYTQTNSDISDAVSLRHSHGNKSVLDATTASFTTANQSKLAGIEAGADVTDSANVAAAGAFIKASDDTDDITEGSTNLFFTNTRADARIGAASINALSDVNTSSTPPTDGQALVWSHADSTWEPGTIAGGSGAVNSVNTKTGTVVLTPDDLDDTSSTHKFVTATDKTHLSNLSGTNTGDQTLPVGGTPSITLGTSNSAGTSPNFLRRDDTILAFDATAPSTQAFGDSASVGVATVASRRDHKHAMPASTKDTTANTGVLKGNGSTVSGSATLTDVGTPTADFSMGSHKLTSVTDPSSAQDAATKNYVDTKTPSRTATITIAPTGTAADVNATGTNDHTPIQSAINGAAAGTRIYLRNGTYNLGAKLTLPSNITLEGESTTGTVLQMAASSNVTVLGNSDTTNGNSFIAVRNLTIKQQGASQTAGGGMSFTGLFDSTFENLYIDTSWTFNFFVSGIAGTTKTGTITATNGSSTVVGSSTAFTTDYAAGDIFKSAGGQFGRILSITDNTHLVLDRPWGWATETGVTHNKVPANARNRIINCTFNGNSQNDNVGLGLFDDGLIQGNVSRNSNGYGFGPDHTNRAKFIGNTSISNPNAGIGMETCGYCVVSNNEIVSCNVGIYVLSGSYRNVINGNNIRSSTNLGINVTYNTTTYPVPDSNTITNNTVSFSTSHGIRVAGAKKTLVANNRSINNGGAGIVTSTDNSIAATDTEIIGNVCYDDQDTKTQTYGIQISSGSNTIIADNIALPADHVTGGIQDSGTNTHINELLDANGNTVIKSVATSSAVSYLQVTNAASAGTVLLKSTASSGTPNFVIQGTGLFAMRPTNNSTNAIRLQDSTGGNNVLVADTTNTRIGINKTTPTDTLDVNGGITATSLALSTALPITSGGIGVSTLLTGALKGNGTGAITQATVNDLGSQTADYSANSHKITNLTDPTGAQDAATKAYVDAAAAGIDWKASVRVATTANGTLSTAFANGQTVDGVTLATGDRILIKDQSTGSQNGLYIVAASGSPTRATDADANAELTGGMAVFVEEGTTNADTGWVLTNNGAITVGTTALTFTQFTGLGQVTAGTGLSKSGSTLSIDSTKIVVNASGTVTLPNATDTLMGKATTDTMTNKTYDTAGTGNVFKINGTTISAVTGSGSAVLATSPTLTTPTIGAATATTVAFNATPSAGAVSGNIITLTSAETQAVGDLVQINSSGNAHLAKADVIANASAILMAASAVSGSASCTYLLPGGIMRLSSSPTWTKGGIVYLSSTGTTGNTLTQTAPSGANNVIQPVGIALAADTLLFNPSLVQVEHT